MPRKPVNIRIATAEDLILFHGKRPQFSCHALVGEVDGEIIAVGAIERPKDRLPSITLRVTDKARAYPLALHKSARRLLAWAQEMNLTPVIAIQDPGESGAARWLEVLGFERWDKSADGDVWIWPNSPR